MSSRIISIGRQFGSGGHEIGEIVSKQLGIKLYEKDILHLACKFGGLAISAMEEADEKATNPYLFQTIHEGNHHVTRGLPISEALFALQSHEIKRIAKLESCIFVGRCADYVLKDEEVRLLRVFISAPFEYRAKRKAELEHLTPDKARRLVKKMDKQRAKYYESFTKRRWGVEANYDLFIDASVTGAQNAAEQIISAYEQL